MIKTFFGTDQLVTAPTAGTFFAALAIGLLFGFALERAGFGSSRRLAGIFYFRDMTVMRVMFTALITAMLGLGLASALGWIDVESQVSLLPTQYAAQALGGLIFGVGFVLSGWCPGTAAVGVAGGKLDALVFLGGAMLGSIAYNETSGWTAALRSPDEVLVAFGMAPATFALLFTFVAIGAFYFAEWVERRVAGGGPYLNSPMLRAFSLALATAAVALFVLPSGPGQAGGEAALLESIEAAEDHIEPEDLADRLLQEQPDLVLVDVRTQAEFERFHIRGAVHVPLAELPGYLAPHKDRGLVVLYSNGMTHPAQARDALARLGHRNVYLLTDGLAGFVERCLKPVSLRSEPLPDEQAQRVRAWRQFFLDSEAPREAAPAAPQPANTPTAAAPPPQSGGLPGLVSTEWLAESLGRPEVKVIDVRKQPEYNASHVPGALSLNPENFRGNVAGVPGMLLPAEIIAGHLGRMGIRPDDTIVLVAGEDVRDATLVGMGLERVGHRRWAILDGGWAKWAVDNRPADAAIPAVPTATYPAPKAPDPFTVDARIVQSRVKDGRTVILDTRPAEYFTGAKSDEARAGHIPGAVNRPFTDDLNTDKQIRPAAELEAAYASLVPSKDAPVVVHCRTGHQASQTYFVLNRLLGYRDVAWYDGSWTEWAARPELPVEK